MRSIFVAVLGGVLTGCALHVGEPGKNGAYIVRHDLGGHGRTQYETWQERFRETGSDHFVIDGTCASFCAFMAMHSPKSCYTENARLGFHAASAFGLWPLRDFTKLMADQLVPPMRDWFYASGLIDMPGLIGVDLTIDELRRIYPEGECGV